MRSRWWQLREKQEAPGARDGIQSSIWPRFFESRMGVDWRKSLFNFHIRMEDQELEKKGWEHLEESLWQFTIFYNMFTSFCIMLHHFTSGCSLDNKFNKNFLLVSSYCTCECATSSPAGFVHPTHWELRWCRSEFAGATKISMTSMDGLYMWLVVWLPFFIFPYIGNNHPNWLSYFSEGFKPPTRYVCFPVCFSFDTSCQMCGQWDPSLIWVISNILCKHPHCMVKEVFFHPLHPTWFLGFLIWTGAGIICYVSSVQNPFWLISIGGYTTQYIEDYHNSSWQIRGSFWPTSLKGRHTGGSWNSGTPSKIRQFWYETHGIWGVVPPC